MKKTTIFLLLFFTTIIVQAQVGINTTIPNAQLDIRSSNQATPTNTDGILIPKVDAFPATNPTAAQQGMLVYLTTTSGTDLPGFYYWDNTTVDWKPITGTSVGTLDQAYDFGGAGNGKTITADAGAVLINGTDGLVSTGTFGSGAVAPSGPGAKMFWNPRKAAFRVGQLYTPKWDDVNLGTFSVAFGLETLASGDNSTAFGTITSAIGEYSTAFGYGTSANGQRSIAFGHNTYSNGSGSTSFGFATTASGNVSTAFGASTIASGNLSTAFGESCNAIGDRSTAFGYTTFANGALSTVSGMYNTASSYAETVIGIGATNYTPSLNGATQANPTDRLFVIGNAIDSDNNNYIHVLEQSDAMIVLKNGLTRLPSTTNAMITAADGKAVVTKEYLLSTTSGTLDQAYDFGGAGNGKTITADAGAVTIEGTDGFVATGTFGSGAIAPSGAGTRMVWNPRKGAFRAGNSVGNEWDDTSLGNYSAAFGLNNTASANNSFATGIGTTASGVSSFGAGFNTVASGDIATAFGYETTASGEGAVAFGNSTDATGYYASSFGSGTTASGIYSTTFGQSTIASAQSSVAFGNQTIANGPNSASFGQQSSASGNVSFSFGQNTGANTAYSAAFGYWSGTGGECAFVAGRYSGAGGEVSTCFGENNTTTANNSFAAGKLNTASGTNSTIFGHNGNAVSFGETVMGIGATTYTTSINGNTQFRTANATDRLFVIGNAIDSNNSGLVDVSERSDAMIVLKNGLTRLPSTTNAMITAADGKAVVTKEYLQSTTSGTLDQAYDFGGAGNGRIITADSGAMTINGTDGLVSTGTFNSGVMAPAGSGTKLVWNPRKAAIRAGNVFGAEWDNANMGSFSAAFGENTIASGPYSFSMGYANTASGQSSVALGQSNFALGNYSIAFGYQTSSNNLYATSFGSFSQATNESATAFGRSTVASGLASTSFGWTNTASGTVSTAFGIGNTASSDYSTAFGRQNSAFSYGETVLGIGATTYTPSTNGNTQFRTANVTDRLFVIGNAIDANNNNTVDTAERSDAMVVLKNGNTGFGTSTPAVNFELRKPDPIFRIAADDTNSSFLQLYEMTAGLPYGYMFEYDGNLDKLYLHSKGFAGNDGIRMTWLKTGNVGIGTFNPNGQFELSLDQGRKPGTNTWTIVSDQRLKTINGTYIKGLNEILQLNPIRFNYKNNGERTFEKEILDTEFAGFIAQEVQPLFPDAVGTDADGFLNFNIHPILIASVNAIKELNAKNQRLEEENQQLKQQLESLLAQQKNQESLNTTIVERLSALETKN